MKYFKVTNVNDPEEEFYISSTLPNETPAHVALTLHLDLDKQYKIEEVSAEEFYRETEEDDPLSFIRSKQDFDCDGDWDWEDDDEFID